MPLSMYIQHKLWDSKKNIDKILQLAAKSFKLLFGPLPIWLIQVLNWLQDLGALLQPHIGT